MEAIDMVEKTEAATELLKKLKIPSLMDQQQFLESWNQDSRRLLELRKYNQFSWFLPCCRGGYEKFQGQARGLLESLAQMVASTESEKEHGLQMGSPSKLIRCPEVIELSCFAAKFTVELETEELRLNLAGIKELVLELSCPICLEILYHPRALKCGHLFCGGCADASLKLSGSRSCPICRMEDASCDTFQMEQLDLVLKKHFKSERKMRAAQERDLQKRLSRDEEKNYIAVP